MGNYHLKILKIVDEAEDIRSFYVEKPDSFIFSPGQFCLVGSRVLPHEHSPMAIASGTREGFLLFTVRRWGKVSSLLFELKVGDVLVVIGPLGTSLRLTELSGSKILCVGGGTGITPIRSLYHSLDSGEVTVLYGAKNESSVLYKDEFADWGVQLITDDVGPVTDLIKEKSHDVAFVVGPTPMIRASIGRLLEKGWDAKDIFVSLEKHVYGEVFGPIFPVSELLKLRNYLDEVLRM